MSSTYSQINCVRLLGNRRCEQQRTIKQSASRCRIRNSKLGCECTCVGLYRKNVGATRTKRIINHYLALPHDCWDLFYCSIEFLHIHYFVSICCVFNKCNIQSKGLRTVGIVVFTVICSNRNISQVDSPSFSGAFLYWRTVCVFCCVLKSLQRRQEVSQDLLIRQCLGFRMDVIEWKITLLASLWYKFKLCGLKNLRWLLLHVYSFFIFLMNYVFVNLRIKHCIRNTDYSFWNL